jgi:hypothetical protein
MGGLKMHVDDPSYKAFIAWIQDYARVVGDRYAGVDELPVDNWHASQHVVLVQDAPESWPESVRIQFFIHAWDAQQESWSEEPIAFTQNSLTPRRIVGGPLFLLRAAGSQEDHDWDTEDGQLAPGKYLVKVYIDTRHCLADDPTVLLSEEDYYGQVEIEARWGRGYPQAERVSGDELN